MSEANLPQGWDNIELGEILEYEQPTKYQVNSIKYSDSYKTPVITPGKSFILGYTNETEGIYNKPPVIIFDDFTTASRYVDFEFKVKSSAMKILSCNTEVANIKYVYYSMQVLECNHDTHKRYWISTYSKLRIPLPSLPVQNRIVDKIEEIFSELDKSIDELKKIGWQIKVYKQAVLDDIIKCDNNIQINDCITSLTQGWSPKCKNISTDDSDIWAVIKTSAIQKMKFDYEENKILPKDLKPREQHEIEVDDILVTRAGPRVRCGVACLVKETKSKLINCDKVYQIKVNKGIATPQFLEYTLNSPALLKEIELIKTGGNESGLNLTQNRFLKLTIPLPSLNEQAEMVSEIESRMSICDKIEETIEYALNQAQSLRLSILKKAFEGKLV